MTQRELAYVLELDWLPYRVCGLFGPAEELDAFQLSPSAFCVRVAPDELLLFGKADELPLSPSLTSGLVIDLSAAFTAVALCGDAREEAFRRLSAIPLERDGVLQGMVAQIPAKVVVQRDSLIVVVSSVVRSHLARRLADVGRDLALVDITLEPVPEESAL